MNAPTGELVKKTGSAAPIVVRIKRQDRPDGAPYWETFALDYRPNMNMTSVLRAIAANPVTVEGKRVAPVNYEVSCLEEVCGSCTMLINGTCRQACSALIDRIRDEHGDAAITVAPMTKFPVVRDLVVDRTRMIENLKRIQGWIPVDGYYDAGPGPKIEPKRQEELYALSRCMTCGCCLEACPQFTKDNHFVGAQVVAQVQYFNRHPGKVGADARLEAVMGEGGISD